jgi:hypothetical protein
MSELEKPQSRKSSTPTRVKVSIKFLKNLGNFENVTLDFEIETDFNAGETVDSALDRAYAKCDEHLGKRMKEVLKAR